MPSKEAPPATLYDEVLTRLKHKLSRRWGRSDRHLVSKKVIDADAFRTRKTLEQAVRYEFDDEACAAAIEFSLEHMGALKEGIRWIRPLAPIMWLECDVSVAMDVQVELSKRHGTTILGGQLPLRGKKLGFLTVPGDNYVSDDPPVFEVRPINIQKDHVALSLTTITIDPLGLRPQVSNERREKILIYRWLIGVEPDKPLSKANRKLMKYFILSPAERYSFT